MKIVNIENCCIDIIECDCGYHVGVDVTYLDQVGDIKTACPSCDSVIDTELLYKE